RSATGPQGPPGDRCRRPGPGTRRGWEGRRADVLREGARRGGVRVPGGPLMATIDRPASEVRGEPSGAGARGGPSSRPEGIPHAPRRPRAATICQVLHALEAGGAEVLAAALARRLGRDYRFLFVCLDGLGSLGRELRDEGFIVEVLDRRPGLDWRC